MSFYKGCNGIYESGMIISDFIDGKVFNPVTRIKEPAAKNPNKYSQWLECQFRRLIPEFGKIIMTEYVMIDLSNLCVNDTATVQGLARNLYHIASAQAKTRNFCKIMCTALSTYAVDSKPLFKAIKTDLEKTQERAERNKQLTNEFAEDCGLSEMAEYIRQTKGISIYDDISTFMENKCKGCLSSDTPLDEEKFSLFRQQYIASLIDIAEKNGIPMLDHAADDAKRHHAKRQAMALEEKAEHDEEKRQEKLKSTEIMINSTLSDLQNSIDNGIGTGKFKTSHYVKYLSHLTDMLSCGKKVFFSFIIIGSGIRYISTEGEPAVSMAKCALSYDRDIISGLAAKAAAKYPKAILPEISYLDPSYVARTAIKDKPAGSDTEAYAASYCRRICQDFATGTNSDMIPSSDMLSLCVRYHGQTRYIMYRCSLKNCTYAFLTANMKWSKQIQTALMSETPETPCTEDGDPEQYIYKTVKICFTDAVYKQYDRMADRAAEIFKEKVRIQNQDNFIRHYPERQYTLLHILCGGINILAGNEKETGITYDSNNGTLDVPDGEIPVTCSILRTEESARKKALELMEHKHFVKIIKLI